MSNHDRWGLMGVVKGDKQNVINFLQAHNLVVKNKITMLFNDGDVDEGKMDQLSFTKLWELQYEPSLVRVEFIIERPKEEHSDITGVLENLLDKIVDRGFPVDRGESLATSTTCPHFKSIKINSKPDGLNIILIGAICYCS